MFKELEKVKTSEVEKSISEKWEKMHILDKCIEKNDKYFVFYDGPATANGFPGLHHMVAKFLKDSFCKYKTMQGYKVLRKVGWDTHGLPVEVEVEKTLGFKNKTDIEKYGIKEFNEKCREIVWKNEKAFSDLTTKMGQFVDLKHPYVTYDNNYIETEWYILKKFFEEGLFYEGVKIVPYCTRCGTGLASHEVAQGYKEVEAQTVIVPMKKKDEDAYFLVWTTTPWTLIANVALCVNPDEDYVKVLSKGYKFILGKNLLSKVLGDEYEILEEYKGKDLEYMEYEQLIPSLNIPGKAFYVTVDNYVTMEDGTGIVHLAPAFGEDDSKVGKKYHLPYVNPVGEDGKYTDGLWKGMNVFEADLEVIKYLKANDKLFKKQKMVHNYPHCWRCGTPLLYYSKPSFYLEITKLKDKIVEANKHVNWYPEYVGEKRFGNWLENLNDWAISRSRYWGTPLPLWRCECGNQEMIGSRKELVDAAIEEIDETIELHRPYVDDIHIKCSKCGKTMNRVKDVIDCWFDSGSMPFAQYHYPFENMELWQTQFPADFISEGIDQTRGWFYSLIVISVFLKGVAPYKNVLVNDLLLDKEGKKMSKSKGNAVDPFEALEQYGADAIRWYFYINSAPWLPNRFHGKAVMEGQRKFMGTLWNTYAFYVLYANIDEFDPSKYSLEYDKLSVMDKWLLSKLNTVVKAVDENLSNYRIPESARALQEFVDDMSNWYVRRSRNRFWQKGMPQDKINAYMTLYTALVTVCKAAAPMIPFMTEEIYQNLVRSIDSQAPESIHLCDFPAVDESMIDAELEANMEMVLKVVVLGRACRNASNIKNRQPIGKMYVKADSELSQFYKEIIEDELNVKEVEFKDDVSAFTTYEFKPQLRTVGPKYGKKLNGIRKYLSEIDGNAAKAELDANGKIVFEVDGDTIELLEEDLLIQMIKMEGYVTEQDKNVTVVLDTNLTAELIEEGFVREIISKIQTMRKEAGFEVTDKIVISAENSVKIAEIIDKNRQMIQNDVLCERIVLEKAQGYTKEWNINGENVILGVEKL